MRWHSPSWSANTLIDDKGAPDWRTRDDETTF